MYVTMYSCLNVGFSNFRDKCDFLLDLQLKTEIQNQSLKHDEIIWKVVYYQPFSLAKNFKKVSSSLYCTVYIH